MFLFALCVSVCLSVCLCLCLCARAQDELLDKHTFQPNPDFWTALLWHRLMERTVLGVTQPATAALVRAYAHCSSGAAGGSVTVAMINADQHTAETVDFSGVAKMVPRHEYRLTGTGGKLESRSMDLNGKTLFMAEDGTLPPLMPQTVVDASIPLVAQPTEIMFVVFDAANAPSCL
eukprot:SAG22_NODE_6723_length_819_cov_1.497222_2_plen_176_part_00